MPLRTEPVGRASAPQIGDMAVLEAAASQVRSYFRAWRSTHSASEPSKIGFANASDLAFHGMNQDDILANGLGPLEEAVSGIRRLRSQGPLQGGVASASKLHTAEKTASIILRCRRAVSSHNFRSLGLVLAEAEISGGVEYFEPLKRVLRPA